MRRWSTGIWRTDASGCWAATSRRSRTSRWPRRSPFPSSRSTPRRSTSASNIWTPTGNAGSSAPPSRPPTRTATAAYRNWISATKPSRHVAPKKNRSLHQLRFFCVARGAVRSAFGDALGDVGQRFFDLVDQDQRQVAFLQAIERRVDGQELAVDLVDPRGARRAVQALAQQRHHFAVDAAALTCVLVQHHVVESAAEDLGLLRDVLVAPVAGAGNDHRAALGRHGFQ